MGGVSNTHQEPLRIADTIMLPSHTILLLSDTIMLPSHTILLLSDTIMLPSHTILLSVTPSCFQVTPSCS
jgi:hypothetical protein